MKAAVQYVVADADCMALQIVQTLCAAVANNLSEMDTREMADSISANPFDIVMHSVELSNALYIILAQGEDLPLGVGGVVNDAITKGKGYIWLLTSTAMKDHPRMLLRGAREVLPKIMAKYEYLENYTHADNIPMQKLLHRVGFHVEPPAPWGMYGKPFCHFWWRNPNV